ncbi:MAG: DUF1553 domain-containing protein [Planctomycetes bacterium]|nr:DUF1553 domain-containing protein [Planctomycetota bacterium]
MNWTYFAYIMLAAAPRTEVFPPRIDLRPGQDFQQLSVFSTRADGLTTEVTRECEFETRPAGLAGLENGRLRAARDGEGVLVVTGRDVKIEVPLSVRGSGKPAAVSFSRDVMPILTRAGCNGGKCHGAAAGKDGFRLSLFGFDPLGDHFRLVEEIADRRVSISRAGQSLLVTKALGAVPHTGGKKIEPGSPFHVQLTRWIHEGAKNDCASVAQPTAIRVYPSAMVMEENKGSGRLVVTADYSDGSIRDVTHLCAFYSSNDGVATPDAQGMVTPTGRGEAFILARFATLTSGTSIITRPADSKFVFPHVVARNAIDEAVHARLGKLHIAPADTCDDAVFLRRASIDLNGRLPEPAELEAFLADNRPDKRDRVVEALAGRPEFHDLWVMRFSEMLQIRTANGASPKGVGKYHDWLRDRITSGATIDKLVSEILSTTGGTFEKPAANYYQTETEPATLAENVAQAFLGMRIQCAQCHNHPFDRWTMDDYYGFTAFFSQVGYKSAPEPREIVIFNRGEGEIEHPLTKKPAVPRFLGSRSDSPVPTGADRREALAKWLADPANPYFARHVANIAWSHFMGRGIVEPVDDVRSSNPPSNPELLELLTRQLLESRFDMRKLAVLICQSRTYQLATTKKDASQADSAAFAVANIRRMRAEVLLDCLAQATGEPNKFPGRPAGTKAVQLLDGRTTNHFLTTFGRATRETPCACEVKSEPTLSQALHMLNGENTTAKIASGSRLKEILEKPGDTSTAVEQLFIVAFSRKPDANERLGLAGIARNQPDRRVMLEDIFWSLLNSREFMFNH